MLTLGIDDAGRGPVIGPMILAGCLMTEEVELEFKKIGVKDSKEITQRRREFFENQIKEKILDFNIQMVSPDEIDNHNQTGTKLNELEANLVAIIINKINHKKERIKVIIDCPSVSILKWTNYLRTKIDNPSNLDLIVKHKADRDHAVVSAASILAKCAREREIDKLKKIYGEEIGSGYPSDPLTCRYLEKNALKQKDSGIFRKTWSTWKDACHKIEQGKLF